MRLLNLLVYMWAGLWMTCHFIPTVELRKRSKKKNKGDTPEDLNHGIKRHRETISQEDLVSQDPIDKVTTTTTAQLKTKKPGKPVKHGKPDKQASTAQKNSSSKKVRGSKRQKKKEKRKKKHPDRGDASSDDSTPAHRARNKKRDSSKWKNNQNQEENEKDGFISKVAQSVTGVLKAAESVGSMLKAANSFSRTFDTASDQSEKPEKASLCSVKLGRRLIDFYEAEVEISDDEINDATEIVENFLSLIWPSIQRNTEDLDFGEYSMVGSMSEGLGAVEIHDFDIHIPVLMDSDKLTTLDTKLPGYKEIQCSSCQHNVHHSEGRMLLSPSEVLKKIQSIVQKTVSRIQMITGCSRYRPGVKGPTVSVDIDCTLEGVDRTIRVEFVPLVTTNTGEMFVAKSADNNPILSYPLAWRQSFADQEREFIAGKSEDDLRVLKLMKAIAQHEEPSLNLKPLSSYQLKTVYCHMDRSGYEWQSFNLCDQFVDFLETLATFLEKQNLPNCFNEDVNLFGIQNSSTLKNLHRRILAFKGNIPKFMNKLFPILIGNIPDIDHDEF